MQRDGAGGQLRVTGGRELARRVRRRSSLVLAAANLVGAIVTFFIGAAAPQPRAGLAAANIRLNVIVFCIVMPLGIAAGFWLSRDLSRLDWLEDERTPSAQERDNTLRFPIRQTARQALLWVVVAVVFTAINAPDSLLLGAEAGFAVLLGGVTTCSLTYLLGERLSRPALACALERRPPEQPVGPGVGTRLTLTWVAVSAVPLVVAGLIGVAMLGVGHASRERVGIAIVAIAVVGVVAGLLAVTTSARLLTEPLNALRGGLRRVESGELDATVRVADAGEIGLLQAGFNRMASGLRERERLRDLFGRHVGQEVMREALQRDGTELGGEVREAAVLFVDVIGSTALAAAADPRRVVELLNEFFRIVVAAVTEQGGWVNKFEGDAALCIFGAPTVHENCANAALAAARDLRARLDRELPRLDSAIGVSAGSVVAGNVGAAERYEYTVIGDPVNEAARLTELAKAMPGRLLASDAALDRADEAERERWRIGRSETLRGRARPTRLAVPA